MAEEIILKNSRKAFLLEYLLVLIAIAIFLRIIIKGYEMNGILVLALGIAAFIGLIRPEIARKRMVCVITPEAVTIKKGILSKREHQFHMSSITDVNYEQNIWQRIWNYGDIIIRSFSHAGKKIKVANVHNPKETMAAVHRLVDKKIDKSSSKPITTDEE